MANRLVKNTIFVLLLSLFAFLPFSSWIVSLSGNSNWSLIRDGLVGLLFIFSIASYWDLFQSGRRENQLRRPHVICGSAWLLILWGLLSYFWREASPVQWLRGIRFDFMPLVLFLALSQIKIDPQKRIWLYRSIIFIALVIVALAVLTALGVKIPLYTDYNATGAITEINYIGGLSIVRWRSVLISPNALALYMLAVLPLLFAARKKYLSYTLAAITIAALFLTFSRGVLIGFLAMVLIAVFIYAREKIGLFKAGLGIGLMTVFLIASFAFIYQLPQFHDFATHGYSTDLRWEQYQRIWQHKYEIGLLGRGAGGAGPSSQNRLDNGPNWWTENVYLDIFEEFGLIGLLIYLALIARLLFENKTIDTPARKTALLVLASFSIAGVFVNYCTGQVGIYLFWLMMGLAAGNDKIQIPNAE